MSSVDQAVRGGWYELREHLRRPRDLFNHLFPGSEANAVSGLLSEAAADLDNAVEDGVLEVKRRRMNILYVELEDAEYSSDVFSRLGSLSRRAAVTILIMGIQRAYLTEEVTLEHDDEDEAGQSGGAPTGEASGETAETTMDANDIKEIIADVQQIIAADPSAKMNGAIKNIMLQLQKYRTEAATFRKLKEQSSGYRLEMYSKTFAATFQNIFNSIRRNYESYQAEQKGRPRTTPSVVLSELNTTHWARVVSQQLEEADRLRSGLAFLAGRHSSLREPVVALARRRGTMGELFQVEVTTAEDCTGSESTAWRLNRLMARDIARRLRRFSTG